MAWLVAGPLFVLAQLVVQAAWSTPFSWAVNNISDLGNARCQLWGDRPRYVCSPLHPLMNAAFAATGLLVLAGTVLLRRHSDLGRGRSPRWLLGLAGLGYAVAGAAPADQHENVHVVLGAVPIFFAGNTALLLFAAGRSASVWIRRSALLGGVVGVTATVLFVGHHDLGLGLGWMERAAALPLHGFLLAVGVHVLLQRVQWSTRAGGRHRSGRLSSR